MALKSAKNFLNFNLPLMVCLPVLREQKTMEKPYRFDRVKFEKRAQNGRGEIMAGLRGEEGKKFVENSFKIAYSLPS